MSVSNSLPTDSITTSIFVKPATQQAVDFQSLSTALQSGDLNAAHEALAALQKDNQSIQNARWIYRAGGER